MAWKRIALALAATTVLTIAAGCATTSGRVYVRTAPPPLAVERVDRRIASPGPEFVWQPGFYRWSGRDYVWVPGHYQQRARPGAVWLPGLWRHDRNGWYFVEGHWR